MWTIALRTLGVRVIGDSAGGGVGWAILGEESEDGASGSVVGEVPASSSGVAGGASGGGGGGGGGFAAWIALAKAMVRLP